jgi:signal transduction histidine kinase/CheY-like chemotaxis protein
VTTTRALAPHPRFHLRPLSAAVVALAALLAVGLILLSRDDNQRDEQHLVTLQAGDAKTTFTSVIAELESIMSPLGSVAAATDANPTAMHRLTSSDPSLQAFPSLEVLRASGSGSLHTAFKQVDPGENPTLNASMTRSLGHMEQVGGFRILGFTGSGKTRTLAIAEAKPFVPDGYVVFGEVPLPAGRNAKSSIAGLQYALYTGSTTSSPVLLSTSTHLPLTGQVVKQYVNLDDLDSPAAPTRGSSTILLAVSVSGSLTGTLPGLLPWILGVIALLVGVLVAFSLEVTYRRRDHALALVDDLAGKNAKLDEAMAEQIQAEKTRTKLENELRQAQRMEAVGRLAGGVAHDFNNLLAVILNYADFISEELPENSQLQDDISEVSNAARRAAELTRQLLVFSRRDLVTPSVIDVNQSINNLLNLLQRTLPEEIALSTQLAPSLPNVLADPGELEQVLVNLVVNARDAISGPGAITVETTEQTIDETAAEAHAGLSAGTYVRIAVTDTGSGMDPEVANRVFEPFFTTKEPGSGTGLGLATVYAIANRYGGCVTVYSEIGLGTSMKVYLPATNKNIEPAEGTVQNSEPTATGETVLLVEDEDAVRSACRRILERAGFNVHEASNGANALTEAPEHVDLLLTDVIMPGGVSGKDLADSLQREHPELKVVFMSGYSADAIATRGILDAGIAVIEKPFTTSDLLTKVREVLV